MNEVFISIGANLGNREEMVSKSLDFLAVQGEIISFSTIYETASWGYSDENPYLNMVIFLKTNLKAVDVLKKLHMFEEENGRKRSGNGYIGRTIDLDILFFNNELINSPELVVPHPKIELRSFILTPLAEIAADFIHPVLNIRIDLLLKECKDELFVKPFACAL